MIDGSISVVAAWFVQQSVRAILEDDHVFKVLGERVRNGIAFHKGEIPRGVCDGTENR